jgi:hypothetical protein
MAALRARVRKTFGCTLLQRFWLLAVVSIVAVTTRPLLDALASRRDGHPPPSCGPPVSSELTASTVFAASYLPCQWRNRLHDRAPLFSQAPGWPGDGHAKEGCCRPR